MNRKPGWMPPTGANRVPWLRKLEDNPALPDRKPGYVPDPIELNSEGKRVSKAELYQRMVQALADPSCTAFRALELQRIWMRLPKCGLRSWGHIVADAKAQAEASAKDYWYTFSVEQADGETYAVVWRQWANAIKPQEYICTVYIPAPAGEEPQKAIRIARTIAEALNRIERTRQPSDSPNTSASS